MAAGWTPFIGVWGCEMYVIGGRLPPLDDDGRWSALFAAAAIAETAMDGLANLEGSTFQRATCFPFSCLMAESVKSTGK